MLQARFGTTLCKCGRASDRLCIRERCLLSVNWILCCTPLLCLFSTLREVDLDFHISRRATVPGLVYFTRAIHSSAYNADQRCLVRTIGSPTCKYQLRKRIERWRWSMIVQRARTCNRNDSSFGFFSRYLIKHQSTRRDNKRFVLIDTCIYQLAIT